MEESIEVLKQKLDSAEMERKEAELTLQMERIDNAHNKILVAVAEKKQRDLKEEKEMVEFRNKLLLKKIASKEGEIEVTKSHLADVQDVLLNTQELLVGQMSMLKFAREINNQRKLEVELLRKERAEARQKLTEAIQCSICLEGVQNPAIGKECGHWFCSPCISNYEDHHRALVLEAGVLYNLRCPQCKCPMQIVFSGHPFRGVVESIHSAVLPNLR